MSLILILSYRLKQMTYSNVLQCFEIQRIAHISWTRCQIVMGYGSKCRIWYVQKGYIENSKLNIADKWLISLDHVTYSRERCLLSRASVFSHVQKRILGLTHKGCVLQRRSFGAFSDVTVVLWMRQSIAQKHGTVRNGVESIWEFTGILWFPHPLPTY